MAQGINIPDSSMDVIEHGLESVRILPTAAGDLASCDDIKVELEEESSDGHLTESQGENTKEGPIEMLEWDWDGRKIVGLALNNHNSVMSIVDVEFALFDKDGIKVGTASDLVQTLGPGEKWRFEANVYADEAVNAELIGFEWLVE